LTSRRASRPLHSTSGDADVIVVGGGAGGLTTATQAARRGARVILITDGPLGGECTHTGCVPSKALLAAAAAGDDFDAAVTSVRSAVERVAATEDETALARAGVAVIKGHAELRAPDRARVGGKDLRARRIVLATGATAALPPIPGLAEVGALTNATVFSLGRLPAAVAIIGGGAVGCELAQALARFGSTTTVVEATERLLPTEDPEVSAVIAAALREDGVDLHLGAGMGGANRVGHRRGLHLHDGTQIVADQILVAAGRRPRTDGLDLEAIGIDVDPGGRIVVDDRCSTSAPGVLAVGDVTQIGGFTHMAAHMGFVAAANACRTGRLRPAARIDRRVVPGVTFTDPQVAHVGISETEAVALGGRVAHLPLDRVDRAIIDGRTRGFVKLIAGPRPVLRSLGGGRVLGATIVAPAAGEMIHEVALAMRARMFTGRLVQTTRAYPTWSTAIQQAATQFFYATDGLEARPARTPG